MKTRTWFIQVDQIVQIGHSLTITATDIDKSGIRLLATGRIVGGSEDGETIHRAYEVGVGKTINLGPHVAIALSEVAEHVAVLAIFAMPNMLIQTVQHPK